MTDPKVLADALVDAEILEQAERGLYSIGTMRAVHAKAIITDWRVAGKVLEDWSFDLNDHVFITINFEAVASTDWLRDPRAIIEAWYASRESGDDTEKKS